MARITTTVVDRLLDRLGHHTHKHERQLWTGPKHAPIYGISVCRCESAADTNEVTTMSPDRVIWDPHIIHALNRMETVYNRRKLRRPSDPDYEKFITPEAHD
jgi:hypothetical protein